MGNVCLGESGPAPITLHVYDAGGTEMVKNVNSFLREFGTGAFHSAVEVYGKEWSFGFTHDGSSGIFCCPPRRCKTHSYREALSLGDTSLSQNEVEELLAKLALDWRGAQYDVLRRNCTHFSEEFCRHLGVGPCPDWVGNIALAGRTMDVGIQRVASFRSASFCDNSASNGPQRPVGPPGTRSPSRRRASSRGRPRPCSVKHEDQFVNPIRGLVGSMRSVQSCNMESMNNKLCSESIKS